MNTCIYSLEEQKKALEAQILAVKIQQRKAKPAPRFVDGMGVIEEGFYGRNYMTEIILGSGREEDDYYGLQLMRGCKHCMKYKHAWGNSNSWGGYAEAVTRRYLRRYWPKKLWFGEELMEIIYSLADRFPIHANTRSSYFDSFRIYPNDCRVIFKGRTFYLNEDRYKTLIGLKEVKQKFHQLEVKYNEAKND